MSVKYFTEDSEISIAPASGFMKRGAGKKRASTAPVLCMNDGPAMAMSIALTHAAEIFLYTEKISE